MLIEVFLSEKVILVITNWGISTTAGLSRGVQVQLLFELDEKQTLCDLVCQVLECL